MYENLKSCPFCGSDAHLQTVFIYGRKGYRVFCENQQCPIGPTTATFMKLDDAERAWNGRAENEPAG